MSRTGFQIEKFLQITPENAGGGVRIVFGSAVPGGDAGEQDGAGVGSVYLRTNGTMYQKLANVGSTADWTLMQTTALLSWRAERVIAATTQVAPASGSTINLTSAPLTGDETPLLTAASFVAGDHIIFGVGGTPKLMQVSVVAAPSITVVDSLDPLSDNDSFIVRSYLPDSDGSQENTAIVSYQGSAIVKIADVDWNLATGISMNGLVDRQGPVLGTDTLQVSIEKLEGDSKDTAVLSGVARGATDLGVFTGAIIPDSQKIKEALQTLETYLEQNGRTSLAAVTTITTLDSVLVDDVKASKWEVHVRKQSNPSDVKAFAVYAVHNGTPSADATNSDDTVYAKLNLGANFNVSLTVDVNGAGASQTMRLRVTSTEIGGVDVFAYRRDVK